MVPAPGWTPGTGEGGAPVRDPRVAFSALGAALASLPERYGRNVLAASGYDGAVFAALVFAVLSGLALAGSLDAFDRGLNGPAAIGAAIFVVALSVAASILWAIGIEFGQFPAEPRS